MAIRVFRVIRVRDIAFSTTRYPAPTVCQEIYFRKLPKCLSSTLPATASPTF